MKKLLSCLFAALFVLSSCNKDDVIEVDSQTAPRITLDSENAVYTIKSGRELTISPTYENADKALYVWKIDGKVVGTQPALTVCEQTVGELFVLLQVSNRYGTASEELRVDVVELEIPTISLPVPEKGYTIGRQSSDAETLRNRHLDPHDLHMERERQRSFLRKGIYIRHVRSRRLYARIRHPQ